MKLKDILFLSAFIAVGSPTFAQYSTDALMFSQFEQGATARFKGLGNAQTALGGDLSSLAGNPAGLGLFTRSEISLGTDFSNHKVESQYINQFSNSNKDRFGINNGGVVFHSPSWRSRGEDLKTGWLSVNFGAGFNRTNNFNTTIDYSGKNPTSSIADFFADQADLFSKTNSGGFVDPAVDNTALSGSPLAQMAWENFLIDFNPAGYIPTTQLNSNQENRVFRTGSQSEVNFAVAANYSNQLYLGASVGLSTLNFDSDRTFTESGSTEPFIDPRLNGTYNLSYRTSQTTRGTGANLKAGMIYRANDFLRVGLSMASPTWFRINDSFSEVLDTRYSNFTYTNTPAIYDFSYNLRTPFRINGGLAFILSQKGLLSADVEYLDYSTIRITSDDRNVDALDNSEIRNNYKSAVNFRVGGEYKVIDNFMIRAGYDYMGSPYKHQQNQYANTRTFAGGIGYRAKLLYFDVAYQNRTFKTSNTPYVIDPGYPDFNTTGPGQTALLKHTNNSVFLTVGTRF